MQGSPSMAPRWFSENPDRAWAERFFLLYSPIWIVAVAILVLTGALKGWSDGAYLVFCGGLALPLLLVPPIALRTAGFSFPGGYWLKFNLWIALFVFWGTYVGTHYFFDVLGMRYAFPVQWHLDAALVGNDTGDVPVFMYPLTQCYFVTYFTVLGVASRRMRTSALGRAPGGRWLCALGLCALAYAIAFAETFFMASDALSDLFWYLDRERMLALGSIFYATYFVIGAPLVERIDEPSLDRDGHGAWTLGRTALSALAASTLVFYALELWTQLFGVLVES